MENQNPNPLSADTLAQIQALARQISVANHLDPEIQAELESHLEDKTRDYLSGQQQLAEPDAMLLTRAHFGKADVIKSLLQHVHISDYRLSLARRIAAIVCAVAAIDFLNEVLYLGVASNPDMGFRLLLSISLRVGGLLALFGLLLYWRSPSEQQRPVWFQTLATRSLIVLVITVILLFTGWQFFGMPVIYQYVFSKTVPMQILYSPWISLVRNACGMTLLACSCLVWLWWADSRPRSRYSLLCAGLAWLAYEFYTPLTSLVLLLALGGHEARLRIASLGYQSGSYVAVATLVAILYALFTRRFSRPSPVTR